METIQNGGTIMRISDKGKAVTLTEIEAQRQGYYHPAMEATRRYCNRDQGDTTRDALEYFKSLNQGIPFDAIPAPEWNFHHIDLNKTVVEQDDPERKPRGQAIAVMRAKMLDELAAARAEVARINRNIIRFDEDFMP